MPAASTPSPQLILEKQESLGQDRFAKNGVIKEVFFVAKNIPFSIVVASPHVNLAVNPINAKLFYDSNSLDASKEVETLKCNPIEYRTQVNETSDKATIEIRAGVLSSQHEGAFFRIKISVTDSKNKKTYEVYSQPIKVISKRNQAKRMIAKNELLPTDPIPPPKRVTSDQITESLARLEAQQKEQAKLIQLLVAREQSQALITKLEPSSTSICHNSSSPSKKRKLDTTSESFEESFCTFLEAFRRVPQEERSHKLRKVLQSFSTDLDTLNDFAKNYSDVVACLAPSSPFSDDFSSPTHEDYLDSTAMFDAQSFDANTGNGTLQSSSVCQDGDLVDDALYSQFFEDIQGSSLSSTHRILEVDVSAL